MATKKKVEEKEIVIAAADETSVPAVEVEKTELEPLIEATAIVPHVVHEINMDAAGATDAPQVLTTKGDSAKRVEILFDGTLGTKLLKKGDITDDSEYVSLLKTERGQKLVREVK